MVVDFRLEPIYTTAPAASKNDALENKQLASYYVSSTRSNRYLSPVLKMESVEGLFKVETRRR